MIHSAKACFIAAAAWKACLLYTSYNAAKTSESQNGMERENKEIVYSDPVRRTTLMSGVLEVLTEGYGFLRSDNYQSGENDVYVSPTQIRRFNLKTGDFIVGNTRMQHEGEKYQALLYVKTVNGDKVDVSIKRKAFDDLTPVSYTHLPTSGKVWIEGYDTSDESVTFDIRRRVGMVFQNPDNQMVANIVEEDVAFAPENLGVPPEEMCIRDRHKSIHKHYGKQLQIDLRYCKN